jgi:hypothetical protein
MALMQLVCRHRLPGTLQAAAQQLLLASQHSSKCAYSPPAYSEGFSPCRTGTNYLHTLSAADLLQRRRSKCKHPATQQQQQQQQWHGDDVASLGALHALSNPWLHPLASQQQQQQQQQQRHQLLFWHQPWHGQAVHSWQQQHCYSTNSTSSSTDSTITSSNSSSSSGRPKSSKGTLPNEGPSHKMLRALPFVISRADAVAAFTAYHSK